MIFQSFILSNLVYLCMKIMNSVVVVGLYYEFLSIFSIGPSYLFFLRVLRQKRYFTLNFILKHIQAVQLLLIQCQSIIFIFIL
ncbi:hypothetical protein Ahy_B03g062516 [Arachis hypogaea]|uniref:Protein TIC 214 n=1 Tax=Arachis hypogaea TaxID=3818 RepID=A0A444ZUD2_ARAHY|nr:hypothetical protein Ahy_B03g062516 [Arachis hypogaea]